MVGRCDRHEAADRARSRTAQRRARNQPAHAVRDDGDSSAAAFMLQIPQNLSHTAGVGVDVGKERFEVDASNRRKAGNA